MKDLNKAKELLCAEGYTCVVCSGNIIYTSTQRGVKPLVAWLEGSADFHGFCAADKVVGKATAFLYVLHRIKAMYAHVISRSALQVLTENHIEVEYGELVVSIVNRQGNGICPFEAAVLDVADPATAYRSIRKTMDEMNIII